MMKAGKISCTFHVFLIIKSFKMEIQHSYFRIPKLETGGNNMSKEQQTSIKSISTDYQQSVIVHRSLAHARCNIHNNASINGSTHGITDR